MMEEKGRGKGGGDIVEINRLAPMGVEERRNLIQVVRGEKSPTVWIRRARYANVVTGEWEEGEILLYGRRIAYMGKKEPNVSSETQIIDGRGFYLVPGYIEPHAHPFQLYHPLTLADYALERGTTLLINDNMILFHTFSPDEVIAYMERFARHPVKLLWWVRLSPQATDQTLAKRFRREEIRRLAEHPLVLQGGEVTDLFPLFQGDREALEKLQEVTEAGKRIEGHAPGASLETLTALVHAGITSDHEAINGEEALRRLRLGLYVPLRHSSIRRDLPELLRGLRDLRYGWERLMFTTDGSTPPFLRHGLTDYLLRIAMEEGMDPLLAYRIASLNPAAYYRIDGEVGMIAPGRLADLNFLEDPRNPTPVRVMIEGEMMWDTEGKTGKAAKKNDPRINAERRERIEVDWTAWAKGGASFSRSIAPNQFRIPWEDGKPFPVVHFISDVITVGREVLLPVRDGYVEPDGEDLLYAALIDKNGRWITRGVVSGFAKEVDALASTYTASQDLLLLGKDVERMAEAYRRAQEQPGIFIYHGDEVEHLPLPIGGGLSPLALSDLIGESARIQKSMEEMGFSHLDLFYALLFFTSTHLPKWRFTEQGILSVKDRRIILPSVPLV